MIREKSVKIRISFFVKACGEQLNTVVEANLDPIDEVNYALIEDNIPNNGFTKYFTSKKTTDRENIHNKLSRSSSITSNSIQLLNDKNDSSIIEFGNAVRFFDQIGHKTMYGNKEFFTKSYCRQTYQTRRLIFVKMFLKILISTIL